MYVSNKPKKKLLERARDTLRIKHYALLTEEAYIHWIKRYILFLKTKEDTFLHPKDLGRAEIEAFHGNLFSALI